MTMVNYGTGRNVRSRPRRRCALFSRPGLRPTSLYRFTGVSTALFRRLIGGAFLAADLATFAPHLHEIFSNGFRLRLVEKLSNLWRYLFCHESIVRNPGTEIKHRYLTYATPIAYNKIREVAITSRSSQLGNPFHSTVKHASNAGGKGKQVGHTA